MRDCYEDLSPDESGFYAVMIDFVNLRDNPGLIPKIILNSTSSDIRQGNDEVADMAGTLKNYQSANRNN